MKYIKEYNYNNDIIYEKSLMTRLSDAFVIFMNNIEPELKCISKKDYDGIWLISEDNKKLVYFKNYYISVEVIQFYKPELVNFFSEIAYFRDKIQNNRHKHYNDEDAGIDGKAISFEILNDDIPTFIYNLTITNYDKYILKSDSNKYNL